MHSKEDSASFRNFIEITSLPSGLLVCLFLWIQGRQAVGYKVFSLLHHKNWNQIILVGLLSGPNRAYHNAALNIELEPFVLILFPWYSVCFLHSSISGHVKASFVSK